MVLPGKKTSEKMVIILRKDLALSKGKTAAQAAHAAVGLALKKKALKSSKWSESGAKKVILYAEGVEELLSLKRKAERMGLKTCLVEDAGLTEVEQGTITCLGVGPGEEEQIDRITGHLPLVK